MPLIVTSWISLSRAWALQWWYSMKPSTLTCWDPLQHFNLRSWKRKPQHYRVESRRRVSKLKARANKQHHTWQQKNYYEWGLEYIWVNHIYLYYHLVRFSEVGRIPKAFCSVEYVGTRTRWPPTDFTGLLKAVTTLLKNNAIRAPRTPVIVLKALQVRNLKYCMEGLRLEFHIWPGFECKV